MSDHLVSTLSCLISAIICYLDASDMLFYSWAQWRTVLGYTWQQELKMTGSLQGKLFFIQTNTLWCILHCLRFLCFTQCSSLFLWIVLGYIVLGYTVLHPAIHRSLCALATWAWPVQAARSLCRWTGNVITNLPSRAQSNQLVTSQAEWEAFVTGSWQHRKACE